MGCYLSAKKKSTTLYKGKQIAHVCNSQDTGEQKVQLAGLQDSKSILGHKQNAMFRLVLWSGAYSLNGALALNLLPGLNLVGLPNLKTFYVTFRAKEYVDKKYEFAHQICFLGKMEYSVVTRVRHRKNTESPNMAIKPITYRTPVSCSNHGNTGLKSLSGCLPVVLHLLLVLSELF